MDYLTLDQCKNLKEWGLPQSTPLQYFSKVVGKGSYLLHEDSDQFPGINPVACPSLEELIEWLGKDFMRLVHQGNDTWGIWSNNGTSYCCYKTPLEAVFALAEALHQPKD